MMLGLLAEFSDTDLAWLATLAGAIGTAIGVGGTKLIDFIRVRGQQRQDEKKLDGEQRRENESVAITVMQSQIERLEKVVATQGQRIEAITKSEAACQARLAAMNVQIEFLQRELQSLRPQKAVVAAVVEKMAEQSGLNPVIQAEIEK